MADSNIEPQTPVVASNQNDSGEQDIKGKDSTNASDVISPAEEARRKAQSRSDKNASESVELQQQINQITPYVAKFAQKEAVDEFILANEATYPDVSKDDLIFMGAFSPEELEASAKWLQAKAVQMQNDALAKVQAGPQEVILTEAERNEQLKELRDKGTGGSKFQKYLKIVGSRTE